MYGLEKKGELKEAYEKHLTDENIILHYKLKISEIHKDTLDRQISKHEKKKAEAEAEVARLEETSHESEGDSSLSFYRSIVDNEEYLMDRDKKLRNELKEGGLWG